MAKKGLTGFTGGLGQAMKNLGHAFPKKAGVRLVGGSLGGQTGGGKGAGTKSGDVKMKPIGGKSVACCKQGKGPKINLQSKTGMTTKNIGGGGKKLPSGDVKLQP